MANSPDSYDFILLDSPPQLGVFTRNVLTASNLLVVPLDGGFYSLAGPLFLGCIGGVFALSRTIIPLIKDYPMAVGFSFMGLILGSLPVIARHAFNDGFKPKLYNIALGLFCLGIMITMSYMEKSKLELNSGYNFKNMNYQLFFVLIITSSIAAIAMIIPGISGSLVMLMLGTYTIVIKGIGNVDFAILIPTALGVLLGLGIGISGIKKAMTYFPQAMYFSILGLVAGSLWPVFPGFKPGVEGFVPRKF